MQGSRHSSLAVLPSTRGSTSSVLLTPGRTRNIAQDMEALRLSRQDNPYLQRVMASRDSLLEDHIVDGVSSECESDDVVLMSQEFGSVTLESVEEDPLTLKEVHDHMIRSPPPTHHFGDQILAGSAITNPMDGPSDEACPSDFYLVLSDNMAFKNSTSCIMAYINIYQIQGSGMFRASSAFDFSNEALSNYSTDSDVEKRPGARARSCGPHRPLSLPVSDESTRNSLNRRSGGDRFSLLRLGNKDENALLVPKDK